MDLPQPDLFGGQRVQPRHERRQRGGAQAEGLPGGERAPHLRRSTTAVMSGPATGGPAIIAGATSGRRMPICSAAAGCPPGAVTSTTPVQEMA
jgi:hypothetical protein